MRDWRVGVGFVWEADGAVDCDAVAENEIFVDKYELLSYIAARIDPGSTVWTEL